MLRDGIPVTSLPRTLLDLAATVRFEWLEKMIERSEDLELFDLRAVEDLLDRTVGHHGHGRLRKAIVLYKPTSFTRSTLEKRFLELCLAAGFGGSLACSRSSDRRCPRLPNAPGLCRAAWRP